MVMRLRTFTHVYSWNTRTSCEYWTSSKRMERGKRDSSLML